MKHTLRLQPLGNMPALSFEWDDETGTLVGRDAKIAGDFIANARRQRFVPIEPHPQGYRLGPVPHSLADLAAIFGQWYVLPDWLEPARPRGEAGDDDAQVIY
jgi:hypothetical protein